ncbi:hypothetical protein AAVH_08767 [Aphelenchoides avenae]|nr:hypothetical protein AAVH_08767 [Aphelenchus avenae]
MSQVSATGSHRTTLHERINSKGLSTEDTLCDVRARQVDKTRLGARRFVEEGVPASRANKHTTKTKVAEARLASDVVEDSSDS